jgi:putative oxidoreductase
MSYATVPLRIALGAIFIFHGAQKLFINGPAATGEAFESMGLAPGTLWAVAVGCVEFFGGLFVLAGLFTRYAAAFIAVVMLGAIFQVHIEHGFDASRGGFEYPFALFCMCVALFIAGAPVLSLDERFEWTKRLDPILRPGM